MPVRLIVCGGREFSDGAFVYRILDYIHSTRVIAEIIQGGAKGADALAKAWAHARGIPCTEVPADWDRHGKRAGPLRNRQMLELRPDGVVAFDGGRGTADMIRQATGVGVPVYRPDRQIPVTARP